MDIWFDMVSSSTHLSWSTRYPCLQRQTARFCKIERDAKGVWRIFPLNEWNLHRCEWKRL